MILYSLLNHNGQQWNSYSTERSQTTQYIEVNIGSTNWSLEGITISMTSHNANLKHVNGLTGI